MHDEAMMRCALARADQAAAMDEVPVGAVVFSEGRVVGEGYNRKECDNDPLAHAEMIAINDASTRLGRWRLTHCTLVVTLEPCPMCAGAAVNARIGRIVFGAHDQKAGACRTLYTISDDERLNHRCKITGGVLEDECIEKLQVFFKAKR